MLSVDLRSERLLNLEKLAIERYTDEIDYSSEIDLYDVIIKHLISGDFNEEYISEYLNKNNRELIMNLVNQYSGLCFYDQDCENWIDSIELPDIGDYRAILSVILENYDFLIRIAANGGKDVLDELSSYVNFAGYNESSIIEYLRVSFNRNDDVIVRILFDMVNNDKYDVFTSEQKACLLAHPLGVLYKYNGTKFDYLEPEDIATNIGNYMHQIEYFGEDEYMDRVVDLTNMLNGILDFDNVVRIMNYEYKKNNKYVDSFDNELVDMFNENDNNIEIEEHKNKMN